MKESDQKVAFILEKFDSNLRFSTRPGFDPAHFLNQIEALRKTISTFKDHWKPKVDALQSPFKEKAVNWLRKPELNPLEEGYSLTNEPGYLLQCYDEQKGHLNPRKMAALTSPTDTLRGLPLYTHPFNELLAFEVSQNLNFNAVLDTCLAMVTSPDFHDVLDTPYEKNSANKEKICVLKKSEEAQSPLELIVSHKDTSADILEAIDQKSFEQVLILDYLTAEMNGSARKYGLKWDKNKLFFIKNNCGQTFSNNYFETDTCLIAFPHVLNPLSEEGKEMLVNFNEEPILYLMRFLGKSEAAISCFTDRVRRMKELARQKPALKAFVPIGLRVNHWKAESLLLALRSEGIVF